MERGTTVLGIDGLEARGKGLISAIVKAAHGFAGRKFALGVGIAKINDAGPFPCVMIQIGDFEAPFLVDEMREFCTFLENCDLAKAEPVLSHARKFIKAALDAADAADKIPPETWESPPPLTIHKESVMQMVADMAGRSQPDHSIIRGRRVASMMESILGGAPIDVDIAIDKQIEHIMSMPDEQVIDEFNTECKAAGLDPVAELKKFRDGLEGIMALVTSAQSTKH